MARTTAAGLSAGLFVLFAPMPARAETSSWEQRIEQAPKRVVPQPAGKAPAKVQSKTVAPSDKPAVMLPGLPYPETSTAGTAKSLGPATLGNQSAHERAAASSDPAYEAFDQGQYLTALDLAQKLAAKGDPQAHTLLGRLHAEGLGVPQSEATAAKWYAKGVELGDIEAAFALGALYAKGVGIERNYAEAARLFEIAAAKEHPLANYNLGLLFLRGQGKVENPHRAFAHIRFAAWRGVVSAQFDLGNLYATGTGTEHNAFEAARWIEKAANAGHPEAEIEFAVTLFKVDAPPGDAAAMITQLDAHKRGARLFRSAAEKGYPVAQNRLARCYAHGQGLDQNNLEAAKWHLIAKAGGVDDAALDTFFSKLSKADRLKAEQQAADWRERSQIQ